MTEPRADLLPTDAARTHRLLTLLTVAGLNLGLLQRQLDGQAAGASVEMRTTLTRLGQAHRAMIEELRPSRREE